MIARRQFYVYAQCIQCFNHRNKIWPANAGKAFVNTGSGHSDLVRQGRNIRAGARCNKFCIINIFHCEGLKFCGISSTFVVGKSK